MASGPPPPSRAWRACWASGRSGRLVGPKIPSASSPGLVPLPGAGPGEENAEHCTEHPTSGSPALQPRIRLEPVAGFEPAAGLLPTRLTRPMPSTARRHWRVSSPGKDETPGAAAGTPELEARRLRRFRALHAGMPPGQGDFSVYRVPCHHDSSTVGCVMSSVSLVPSAELESATFRLGGGRSVLLSYEGV